MRAYLPLTIDEVKEFYLQKTFAPEIIYAPTIKFITANPELDEEEAEYEISMIAARASGGFVIAVELAEKEALFVYDSIEDELTWYATQEIGDYLQSVGSK
jgi:hypothetical protein